MENEVLDNDLKVLATDTRQEYAGFWIRVGASLIDLVVYLPVLGLNMYNVYSLKSLPVQLITTLILLVYKPFMEYRYGATLGKMALKLKVVNTEFEAISLPQAIIRNSPSLLSQLISAFSAVILFTNEDFLAATSMMEVANIQNELIPPVLNYVVSAFYFVSCITVAFTTYKQGLHDMMAKTFCIQK